MNRLKNGFLCVFEGIDGAGKTTVMQAVGQQLQRLGYDILSTKQPGGTPLGASIRDVLQARAGTIDPKAEFFLFAADRAEHINKVVVPALQSGYVVLADRMGDSSVAYQGYGRGVDSAMIKTVNAWAMSGIKPNLTVYIKVPYDIARERVHGRGEAKTAFEREKQAFFQRVAEGFERIFSDRDDVLVCDGHLEPAEISSMIVSAIQGMLPRER
jgi:dTMP kinase